MTFCPLTTHRYLNLIRNDTKQLLMIPMLYGNKMYLNVNKDIVHLNEPLDEWIRWNKAI